MLCLVTAGQKITFKICIVTSVQAIDIPPNPLSDVTDLWLVFIWMISQYRRCLFVCLIIQWFFFHCLTISKLRRRWHMYSWITSNTSKWYICMYIWDICIYCKRGYFRWGKISRKCWQDISRGGNFHDTTPISFIKVYGFYFRVGVIFAKKTKARKTRKLPPRENFHVYSSCIFEVLYFIACQCQYLLHYSSEGHMEE